ncbi:MAG TPA: hypothetical protein VKF84_15045 [Candidatus Sulfotelmatobacter sp.]|nr:hypothetical protein [Candidatus Sulfotelmatobacter sp.]
MSGGDWPTSAVAGNLVPGNLGPGDLTPASAVRPGEGHLADQDASGTARRRPPRKEENSDDESPASESGERPQHQLDDLA